MPTEHFEKTAPDEMVHHPRHYNAHQSGVECIDVIEHFSFNIGNAIKYLWRNGLKSSSNSIEELRKAIWYCEREIERIKKTDIE